MALVGLTMIAFIVIKTGRDALVVGAEGGAERLPLAFGLSGAAALVAATLHVWAMSKLGVRRVRVVLYGWVGALAVLAPWWASSGHPSVHVALFAMTPVVFAALFADAWLLVGDAVDGAGHDEQRRAYVRVAAASTTGGIAGAALAKALAWVLEPHGLLAVGGAILLAGAALSLRAPKREGTPRTRRAQPGVVKVVARLSARPFVALLGTLAALSALVGVLVDLQLYRAAAEHGVADAHFFSTVYLLVSVAALVFQLVAAGVLERRLGLLGVLAALPFGLTGLASVALFSSALSSRLALRAAEGGLRAAVHRAAWERTFQPIPKVLRPYVKTLVDGAAARLAETASGFTLAALGLSLDALTWLTLIAGGLWLAATALLRGFTKEVVDEEGVAEQRLQEACPVASILGRELPP